MSSSGVGWLFAGAKVYRSTNKGADWTDVSPIALSGLPSVAFALDKNHAWLATSSNQLAQTQSEVAFYGTADGGSSWQRLGGQVIDGSLLHQVTFVDPTHGWLLVGRGAATGSEAVSVWGTTDGGRSWVEFARSPMPQRSGAIGELSSDCDKSGITFRDDMTGWVTGGCAAGAPYLYRTKDGGRTWRSQTLPRATGEASLALGYGSNANPPVFLTQSVGLLPVNLVGSNNVPALDVYITRDGGSTWVSTVPVLSGGVMAAISPDYWVVDIPPQQIAATSDGQHYDAISSDTDLTQVEQLSFADEQNGLALVALANGDNELLRTIDGGAHWSAISAST
jgi:photosystem II stability/assembly factor-like uncharacterized protein